MVNNTTAVGNADICGYKVDIHRFAGLYLLSSPGFPHSERTPLAPYSFHLVVLVFSTLHGLSPTYHMYPFLTQSLLPSLLPLLSLASTQFSHTW